MNILKNILNKVSAVTAAIMVLGALPLPPAYAANEETAVFDDFSEYGLGTELTNNYDFFGDSADFCHVEDIGGDYGNAFRIDLGSTRDHTWLTRGLSKAYSQDMVSVEYSIKPASGMTSIFWIYDESMNNFAIPYFNADGNINIPTSNGEKSIGNWNSGGWYKVFADIDMDAKMFDISVTDASGNVVCSESNMYFSLNNIQRYGLQVWSKTDGGSYFDNIKIKAYAKDKFPYYQDFSNSSMGMYPALNTSTNAGVVRYDDERGNVYRLAYEPGADAPSINRNVGIVSDGKIGIKAMIKPDIKNTTSVMVADTRPEGWAQLLAFTNEGKVECGRTEVTLMKSYNPDIWYNVSIVLDLDKNIMDAMVEGADGTKAVAKGWNYGDWSVKNIYFQIWASSGGVSYFDDIEFVRDPEPIESQVILPVDDDFEGYADIEAASKNWEWDAVTKSLSSIKNVGGDYGKSLYVGLNPETDNTWARYVLSDYLKDGKIKVTFDVMPGSGICTHTMMLRYEPYPLTLLFFNNDDGSIYAFSYDKENMRLGRYTADKWYHCEAIIDFENKTADVSCSGDGLNVQRTGINYESFLGGYDWSGLLGFGFQVWSKQNGGSYIDNLKIDYETDTPVVSSKNVSFVKDGEEQTDILNISPLTDEISINFKTIMDFASVKSAVSLKNVTDDTDVAFSGKMNGTKYIMKLPNGLLPEKEYQLTVSKSVKNISGVGAENGLTLSFKAGKGDFKITLGGFSQGNKEISSFADLENAQTAVLKIGYENSTLADKKALVFYNYYDGMKFVKSVCKPLSFLASDRKGTFVDSRKTEIPQNADTMRIMIWDGLENIVPLAKSIELK